MLRIPKDIKKAMQCSTIFFTDASKMEINNWLYRTFDALLTGCQIG